jgi:hypothetical protein
MRFALFPRMRELLRPVTPRQRTSVINATPTTFRDYRQAQRYWKDLNFMVKKGVNRIRAVPFHSIRSSGNRRHSPSGRWRYRRHALSRFAPSPTIKYFRSIAVELRRPLRIVHGYELEIRI